MANNSILDINEILKEYTQDIEDKLYDDAIKLSQKGVNELKNDSPPFTAGRKSTGNYRKGWRVKKSTKGGFVNCTIHNKEYRLTHLLEKPHAIKNKYGYWGTWTPPRKHIEPVEREITKEYYDGMTRYIKNGG